MAFKDFLQLIEVQIPLKNGIGKLMLPRQKRRCPSCPTYSALCFIGVPPQRPSPPAAALVHAIFMKAIEPVRPAIMRALAVADKCVFLLACIPSNEKPGGCSGTR